MDIFGGAWENYTDELTANLNRILTDDSILLIAGDISWAMHLDGAKPDLDFIAGFKGHKVILRGNHDYWWKSISAVRGLVGSKTYAVQNDCVKIGDVIIAGSRGWTEPDGTPENEKIYNREVLRIQMSLDAAVKMREAGDKLIVMTHYPPFTNPQKGSPVTEAIKAASVTAVVYGHIHGKYYKKDIAHTIDDISYYLTSCDILDTIPKKIL
jgi:predicted phosphohydrolase